MDPQDVARDGKREKGWRGVEDGDVDEWKADDEQGPLLARGHSVLCADVITSDDKRLHHAPCNPVLLISVCRKSPFIHCFTLGSFEITHGVHGIRGRT